MTTLRPAFSATTTQLTHSFTPSLSGGRLGWGWVIAALLLASPAQAATLTLAPTADAYVQAGNNANRNYGSATTLRVQTNSTAAKNYDSYLKFDTTPVSGNISNAKLRVYAKLSASGAVSSSAYAIATTTWGETTITWNNKPARGVALGNISVTSTGYAWKEIDVTSYVQNEYAANRKVLSFAYNSGAASSLLTTLQSREGTNKPQLVITTNVAPTVSLTAPANNSSYVSPASITISANAADTDGTIASVAFYNGATLLNTDSSAPYSYTWTGVATGSYILTATATDNAGAVATSSPINISVTPIPNVSPTVSLTTPANNTNYTAPASVNLSANASDSDGSITKVEYYNGAALIGQATGAPYAFTWANVVAGSYSLTAKATDNANATTTSSSINITVSANQAPTVNLQAPSASDSFTAPATFSIIASAADSDGSIQKVEFYNGPTLLGSATQSPYLYDWLNVAAGSYTLTAKAFDNANASTTSAPVTITVNAPQVASGIYYLFADHLNTPRVITDQTNKTVWRWDADPFGTDMASEDPDGDGVKFQYNLRFPGQYWDQETGLHYNYYRDNYFPDLGRYGQSDPIGLEGGLNTYGYVGGNPVNNIDPSGLACTSVGGRLTCSSVNGPTFTLPQPPGFSNFSANDPLYHQYNVTRKVPKGLEKCVLQGLINNPTPGNPRPATPNGTNNNAVVTPPIDNWVTSYLTTDPVSGVPLVVNLSGPGSQFPSGYVARWVANGVVNTYGQGNNILQAPFPSLQNIGNQAVWGNQLNKIIDDCKCKNL